MLFTFDQWIVILSTFMLGVVAKYSDLYNDNGLKETFPGAIYFSGILWGIFGAIQIYFSGFAGLTYIAHILYWFLRVKLDDENHAVAGVIIILAGFLFQGEFMFKHALELVIVTGAYALTGYVHTYFKENFPRSRWFLRLRLRIYLVPLFYGIYVDSIDPIIATISGMIGCEIITYLYRGYKDKDTMVIQPG